MKATASSTRLPRRMKFLNPVMRLNASGQNAIGQEQSHAGVGQPRSRRSARRPRPTRRAGLADRRRPRLGSREREHRHAGGHHAAPPALRVGARSGRSGRRPRAGPPCRRRAAAPARRSGPGRRRSSAGPDQAYVGDRLAAPHAARPGCGPTASPASPLGTGRARTSTARPGRRREHRPGGQVARGGQHADRWAAGARSRPGRRRPRRPPASSAASRRRRASTARRTARNGRAEPVSGASPDGRRDPAGRGPVIHRGRQSAEPAGELALAGGLARRSSVVGCSPVGRRRRAVEPDSGESGADDDSVGSRLDLRRRGCRCGRSRSP